MYSVPPTPGFPASTSRKSAERIRRVSRKNATRATLRFCYVIPRDAQQLRFPRAARAFAAPDRWTGQRAQCWSVPAARTAFTVDTDPIKRLNNSACDETRNLA